MDAILINSILVSAFTILFAALVAYLIRINRQISELQRGMERVTTQVSPLWARVQAQISEDLHHPQAQYAEMDALLEQLQNLTITDSGRIRLKDLLVARASEVDPNITDAQRLKATLMITVMDMVLVESAVGPSAASMESRVVKIDNTKPEAPR